MWRQNKSFNFSHASDPPLLICKMCVTYLFTTHSSAWMKLFRRPPPCRLMLKHFYLTNSKRGIIHASRGRWYVSIILLQWNFGTPNLEFNFHAPFVSGFRIRLGRYLLVKTVLELKLWTLKIIGRISQAKEIFDLLIVLLMSLMSVSIKTILIFWVTKVSVRYEHF